MAAKAEKTKKTADKADEQVSERRKALDMALAQIEKQFGKGSVMRLGENDSVVTFARAEHVEEEADELPEGEAEETTEAVTEE